MGHPLRLLMSQLTMDLWRTELAQCMADTPYELVSFEQALALGRTDGHVAFVTREVTGASTKHNIHPELQRVYDLLRQSQGLQWVQIHSAGADRHIYQDLRERGVQVATSSGANAQVVATVALAGLLALARRFPQMWAEQQARQWVPLLGERMPRELVGQTATVVGWGPIGQKLATFLLALGLKVVVVRRQASVLTEADVTGLDPHGVQMVAFEAMHAVLPHTDWLILACPLTDLTRQLVNAHCLAALPRGAHLINVARGEVVAEDDLVDALARGHLAGAFLDVFAHEPLPPDSPLWSMPQVMVTPHAAGHSSGNEQRVAEMFLTNLRRWVTQKPLLNVVR
jgi:phosphoglycerate dehydrogenase-like enzyme